MTKMVINYRMFKYKFDTITYQCFAIANFCYQFSSRYNKKLKMCVPLT